MSPPPKTLKKLCSFHSQTSIGVSPSGGRLRSLSPLKWRHIAPLNNPNFFRSPKDFAPPKNGGIKDFRFSFAEICSLAVFFTAAYASDVTEATISAVLVPTYVGTSVEPLARTLTAPSDIKVPLRSIPYIDLFFCFRPTCKTQTKIRLPIALYFRPRL